MVDVTDETFQKEVIEKSNKVPVVVDFWAEWCPPCRMLKPIIEKVAEGYKGKIILAKANTDDAPKTSEKYDVMSIPNVKLFKNGKVVDEFVGFIPEESIKKWIDKNL